MAYESPYKVLAGKYGYPDSVRLQRVFEYLMTPQQAKIAVLLPQASTQISAPPGIEEIAANLGIDVATVNLELERLFRKGTVWPENFKTMEGCRLPRGLARLHDHTTMGPVGGDAFVHQKLFELWEDFALEEWYHNNVVTWTKFERPPLRIVPAYKSILDSPQILPAEDVREMIKAQPSIAVVACPCRQHNEAIGKKCKHTYEGACFQFGYVAECIVSRGFGTKLSLEEALQLIEEAEEEGLVHNWMNSSSMIGHGVLCNCCNDCCIVFEPLARFQVPAVKMYAKSRYEARTEPGICTGCQVCVDRCPFEAIDMVKLEGSRRLKAMVDPEKCMGCGVCVVGCEPKALGMKLVRPPEHIPPG